MGEELFREISRTYRDLGLGFSIGEVTVATPSGRTIARPFVHTPEVVSIVAIDSGCLLLIKEYRAAIGRDVVQVPMGKVGKDEPPLAAARRELLEETGYTAADAGWEHIVILESCPGWLDQLMHVYSASQLSKAPSRPTADDPDDVEEQMIELVRIPLSGFRDFMRSGQLRDARTIAAIYATLARQHPEYC
jgi:ADP-ribose pyrophosphatase